MKRISAVQIFSAVFIVLIAVCTPGLSQVQLISPVNETEFIVAEYNNAVDLFKWQSVSGADSYLIELTGPGVIPLRTYTTADTSYWNANASGKDQISPEGTLKWRVAAVTGGATGEWSQTWDLKLVYSKTVNPANLTYLDGSMDDEDVDFLDTFLFCDHWWGVENNAATNYWGPADMDDDGEVENIDMILFQLNYHAFRQLSPDCDLSAPEGIIPADSGTVFYDDDIVQGTAVISWDPVPGAAGYRITFRPTSTPGVAILRDVVGPAYQFTQTDLDDTRLSNGEIVTFTIASKCINATFGPATTPIEFSIVWTD